MGDVVIADCKLKEFTDLTDNQKKANGLTSLILKSISNEINGIIFKDLKVGDNLNKSQNILKIFSDGNGNFSDIKSVP